MSNAKVTAALEVKATTKHASKDMRELGREMQRTDAKVDKLAVAMDRLAQGQTKTTGSTRSAAEASRTVAATYQSEAQAIARLTAANARRARQRVLDNPKATQAQRLAAIKLEERAVINLARVEHRSARTVSESYRARNLAQQAQHDAHMRRLAVERSSVDRGVSEVSGVGATLKGALGPLAAVTAGVYALGAAFDHVSKTSIAFQNISKNLPYSIEQAREATAGLVDDMTLMRGAVSANRFEVAETAEEYATLSKGIQALSLSQGLDATLIQEKVVRGIATRSKKLLDDIGILVDATKANESYAESIGKTAQALTESERNKAYKLEVLRQMTELTKGVKVETDGLAASYQRASVQFDNFFNRLWGDPASVKFAVPVIDPDSAHRESEAKAKRRRDLETWEANGSLTDKAEIEELRQLRESEAKGWAAIAAAMDSRADRADQYIAKVKELGSAWVAANQAEYEAQQKLANANFKKKWEAAGDKWAEGTGKAFEKWGSKTWDRMTKDFEAKAKERTRVAREQAERRQALREAEARAGVASARITLDELRTAEAGYDELREAVDALHVAQWNLNETEAQGAQTRTELVQAATGAMELEATQRRELVELTKTQADEERRRADEAYRAGQAAMQASHGGALGAFDRQTELEAAHRGLASTAASGAPGSLRERVTGESDYVDNSLAAEVADNDARRELRLGQLDEEREFYETRLRLVSDDQKARQELTRIEQEHAQLAHQSTMDQLRLEEQAERRRIQAAQKQARIKTQLYQQGTREAIGFTRTMATTSMRQASVEKDRVAQLREAGATQAEAERQARGESLKTYGGQLVGMAIGHGAEAIGAAASFNYPKMALHLAAAGAYGVAGGTLIAKGNAMGAGGSTPGGGPSMRSPGATPSAGSRPQAVDSPIPPSPRPPAPGGGGESSTPPQTQASQEHQQPIRVETVVQLDTEIIATAIGEHHGGY